MVCVVSDVCVVFSVWCVCVVCMCGMSVRYQDEMSKAKNMKGLVSQGTLS